MIRQSFSEVLLEAFLKIIVGITVGTVVGGLFLLLFAFVAEWLWNAICPELFHLPEITYWQTVGLMILTTILFKSTTTINNKS